jgi:hypothetical protein
LSERIPPSFGFGDVWQPEPEPEGKEIPTRSLPVPLFHNKEVRAMVDLTMNYMAPGATSMDIRGRTINHGAEQGDFRAVLSVKVPRQDWGSDAEEEEAVARALEGEAHQLLPTDGAGNKIPFTRDQAFLCLYVIPRIVASEGTVDIGMTELLHLEGKTKLGREERMQKAREYDAVFTLWSKWAPIGERTWTNSKGKTIPIVGREPIVNYKGPWYAAGDLPGEGEGIGYPACFGFGDSTTTKQYREDSATAQAFGKLGDLLSIPSGKPSGDWAKSIGMAAVTQAKNNAKHTGATRRLTLRTLLTEFTPNNDPAEILASTDPARAKTYLKQAVKILKEREIISSFKLINKDAMSNAKKGWARNFLEEVAEITLAGTWADTCNRAMAHAHARQGKLGPTRPK